MLRCSRVTRAALLNATLLRRAAAPTPSKPTGATTAHAEKVVASANAARCDEEALQHTQGKTNAPSQHPAEHVALPPHENWQPQFFFKGRRGSMAPEYYSNRSSAGHPDPVAELLGASRNDPEWMWLKLLCFLCVSSTFGTTLYGYFFAEHVKYFKDEPWSPFTY